MAVAEINFLFFIFYFLFFIFYLLFVICYLLLGRDSLVVGWGK